MTDLGHPLLQTYLWLCALIAVCLVVRFAWDDFNRQANPAKYSGEKFGYNYKSKASWLLLFLAACPFVNIAAALIFVAIRRLHRPQH